MVISQSHSLYGCLRSEVYGIMLSHADREIFG